MEHKRAIMGALALSGVLAILVAGMREPAKVATVTYLPPPSTKGDRLKIEEPVKVKTEQVLPTRPLQPAENNLVAVEVPEHEEHNICTAHHMHKVETNGGRSWRCRR